MGLGQRKSKGSKGGHKSKNKQYKKGHATKSRRMDIDQIQDMLRAEREANKKTTFEQDDDTPGLGMFYCTPCATHMVDQETLNKHCLSKRHKRRLKDVAQEQYTHMEAERAAGKTKEVYPSAHPDIACSEGGASSGGVTAVAAAAGAASAVGGINSAAATLEVDPDL
ncbi:unnamed protein product [Phaeothamnion confervicola]